MTTPTLDVYTDMSPSPRVRVQFTGYDEAGVDSLTLYRAADGVEYTVRGAVNAFASGGFVVTDYGPPLGVPISYRARLFNVAGDPIGYTVPAVVQIDDYLPGYAIMQDPLNPASAVQVELAGRAGEQISRPIPGQLHRVSSPTGTRIVALVGDEGLATDLNMDFWTDSADLYDAVRDLIKTSSGLLLIRTPPPMRVPRLLYCWAANAVPNEVNYNTDDDTEWSNAVSETSIPDVDIIIGLITYQTYIDAFPTYADAEAAYSTYLAAMANPPGV